MALLCAAALASPIFAKAERSGVLYDVSVTRGAKVLAATQLMGLYGQAVQLEVPGEARVEAMAEAPAADGLARTRARFYVRDGKAMRIAKEMAVQADLARAAPIEFVDARTRVRFVLKARAAPLPGT
jgi:hypothetical protein